jgi:glycosyltransferase involved in cell wall biosynthesis
MQRVVFLQTKFPNNQLELLSLFNRWRMYGETLKKQSKSSGILLFSANGRRADLPKVENIQYVDSIEVHSNPLIRILGLYSFIRKDDCRFILVCGDNHKSFLIALCLKLFLGSKVLIQTQFHGDTYTFHFNKGFRGIIRVCLSRLGIHFSDSIRIVSSFQKDEIARFSPKSSQKFVIAPIPIDYSRIASPLMNKTLDISFVGRLHVERGIDELIEIIKMLKPTYPELRVIIAGDGNLRQKIEDELSHWIALGKVILRGHLNSEQILDLYSETKILISTAPREGYGLTLREAALSQVNVIARYSKGSLEAQYLYPNQIKTYSTVNDAIVLIQESLNRKSMSVAPNLIEKQMQLDSESLMRLVNSWVGR